MRQTIIAVSALVAVLYSVGTSAEEVDFGSAKYVQNACDTLASHTNKSDIWKQLDAETNRKVGICIGALEATVQIMILQNNLCPPQPILKNTDSIQAVSAYMKAHPEKLQEATGYVFFQALKEAWPCTKKNNRAE